MREHSRIGRSAQGTRWPNNVPKIGQFAIAAIRTALNYSLSREMDEERHALASAADASMTT